MSFRERVQAFFTGRSNRSSVRTADDVGDHTFVLLVAVPQCKDSNLPSIDSAIPTVQRIKQALTDPRLSGIPPSNVRPLAGGEATRDAIIAALKTISADVTADDLLLIYFIGHGTDAGFCAADSDPNQAATLVRPEDVADALAFVLARGLVLVFDCCHSAAFVEQVPSLVTRIGLSKFKVVLSSAGAKQKAWDLGGDLGVLFSNRFAAIVTGSVEPVVGPDGSVYLSDIEQDLSAYVTETVSQHNLPAQEPIVFRLASRDPLLFVLKRAALRTVHVRDRRLPASEVYKRSRRVLAWTGAAVLAAVALHYAYLETHHFARREGGYLSIYQGTPSGNLFWGFRFERVLWQVGVSSFTLRPDSALVKEGGTVAFGGVDDALSGLAGEFSDIGTASLTREGNERIRADILRRDAAGDRSVLTLPWLDAVATKADVGLLRKALEAGNTSVLPALARLDPQSGSLLQQHFKFLDPPSVFVLRGLPRGGAAAVHLLREVLLPGAESASSVRLVLDFALRHHVTVTSPELVRLFNQVTEKRAFTESQSYADIGVYAALTGNTEFLSAVADIVRDTSGAELRRATALTVLDAVPPRRETGRPLVPCLDTEAEREATASIAPVIAHVAALHCDSASDAFATKFAGALHVQVARAIAGFGDRQRAVSALQDTLRNLLSSTDVSSRQAIVMDLERLQALEAGPLTDALSKVWKDKTEIGRLERLFLISVLRRLRVPPTMPLEELFQFPEQSTMLETLRWLVRTDPANAKRLNMALARQGPLVVSLVTWTPEELQGFAPEQVRSATTLIAAAGSPEKLAQLLIDPMAETRADAAYGAVLNPNFAEAISRAKNLLRNPVWPQNQIEALERVKAESGELLADIEKLPAWARTWRVSILTSPDVSNANPLSDATLEMVGRAAGVY